MKKLFVLITLFFSCFMFIINTNAEEFTNPNDLEWWVYRDTNTQLKSGRGYIDELFFGSTGANRVQWLFKDYYTYYTGYFYDVSFTVDTSGNYELDSFMNYISKCSIGVGDGKEYKCDLVKSGNYFTISVSNISVDKNTNTLWLNIYTDKNISAQFITSHYSLNIYNKEDKTVTSDILMNSINSMINNSINNTNNIINNQNKNQQQTNEKLDNIDNTLKDDEIDTSGASSFFEDFESKDHGGLSTLITAPLNVIVKITDKCKPIVIDVLGKNITLPCGDTLFWDRPDVKTFRAIWNVIVCGPILYYLLIKLYKVIEGLKNPDDDRIEVVDL